MLRTSVAAPVEAIRVRTRLIEVIFELTRCDVGGKVPRVMAMRLAFVLH